MFKINCSEKKKKQKKSFYVLLSKNNKYKTLFNLGVFNPKSKVYLFNSKKLNIYNKLGYISSKSFLGFYYFYLKLLLN